VLSGVNTPAIVTMSERRKNAIIVRILFLFGEELFQS
jgi:hypothetical protein